MSARKGWLLIERVVVAQMKLLRVDDLPVPDALVEAARVGKAKARVLDVEPEPAGPFLKWVGGKRREAPVLAPLILERLDDDGIYIEPFCGSAAMFLGLDPAPTAVLNDALPAIAHVLTAIKLAPGVLAGALLELLDRGLSSEAYYTVRDDFRELQARDALDVRGVIAFAAAMIYLNRTGFNGLFRTNKHGQHNVSFGKYKAPAFPSEGLLRAVSERLVGTEILCGDWPRPLRLAQPGDCVFADPPYPRTFTGYAGAAAAVDVGALAEALRGAHERGVGSVTTVPGTDEIAEHFEGWCDRHELSRFTGVAQEGKDRGKLDQVAWASRRQVG